MNAVVPVRLTVEEFLRWSMDQERGRFELEDGRIVAMQAENAGHVRTKRRAHDVLAEAITRTGVPFYAMPDGPTVRIAANRAYEPDALVAPLPAIPDTALEVPNPIIVVEVLSPTPNSVRRDLTTKLVGYANVGTIQHYLVLDPEDRVILHFRRRGDLLVLVGERSEGPVRLDPPGIEVSAQDFFGPRFL